MSYRAHLTASVVLLAQFTAAAFAQTTQSVASHVDSLVGQLTMEEKITLLAGVNDMYTRPIDRLQIPSIKMSDGPAGTRSYGKSTAYPAGVLLAATWNQDLAQREGEQLGQDALSRGIRALLGPGLNLYRHPQCGRNFEYFGEDPLLTGKIAAAYVRGVESQGVSATIKHFAMNNQEVDRHFTSAEADERTIRERYLPAFHRAIEEGKPGAVMSSYNRVNGMWTSESKWLLEDILRGEWKFEGLLMSDWDSLHGAIGPLTSGDGSGNAVAEVFQAVDGEAAAEERRGDARDD